MKDKETSNAGWDAGAGRLSRLERLAFSFRGARRRLEDRPVTAIEAIAAGRATVSRLWPRVKDVGGPDFQPRDFKVFLLTKDRDFGFVDDPPIYFEPTTDPEAADMAALARVQDSIPIAIVTAVFIRGEKPRVIPSARPFLIDADSARILELAIADIEQPESYLWRDPEPGQEDF